MGFINETPQAYHEGDNHGGYQYVPLTDIINNFILMFTGEGKVIPKANRSEIQMHAKRCMQEFSYDISKSNKGYEVELSPSLTMILPQDYVNWVKISRIDSRGIKRPLSPVRTTSNPSSILQDSSYDYLFDNDGEIVLATDSVAWNRTKNNSGDSEVVDSQDIFEESTEGARFGLDPEFANVNGGFYIDEVTGLIHFTGGLNGSIIHLDYISDGLGKDDEMVVHKFAEDAVYKYILYTIISLQMNAQEYLVRRYRKNYIAAKNNTKIRLSNYKAEALAQVMRGKSKQIKH